MRYFNAILHDPDFEAVISKIHQLEDQRIFCKHDLSHAFDVARIAWITCLEEKRPFEKEVLYLAALLHDTGRSIDADNHDQASVKIANKLLERHQVPSLMTEQILAAIGGHRKKTLDINLSTCSLSDLIAYADWKSRLCYQCPAKDLCYWPDQKKNYWITY